MFKKQYILERREALGLLMPKEGKHTVYTKSGRNLIKRELTTVDVVSLIVDGKRLELDSDQVFVFEEMPVQKHYYLAIDRTTFIDIDQKKGKVLKIVMNQGVED